MWIQWLQSGTAARHGNPSLDDSRSTLTVTLIPLVAGFGRFIGEYPNMCRIARGGCWIRHQASHPKRFLTRQENALNTSSRNENEHSLAGKAYGRNHDQKKFHAAKHEVLERPARTRNGIMESPMKQRSCQSKSGDQARLADRMPSDLSGLLEQTI